MELQLDICDKMENNDLQNNTKEQWVKRAVKYADKCSIKDLSTTIMIHLRYFKQIQYPIAIEN